MEKHMCCCADSTFLGFTPNNSEHYACYSVNDDKNLSLKHSNPLLESLRH